MIPETQFHVYRVSYKGEDKHIGSAACQDEAEELAKKSLERSFDSSWWLDPPVVKIVKYQKVVELINEGVLK